MPNDMLPELQSDFMTTVIKQAKALAKQNPAILNFDPQGRVLINVKLNETKWNHPDLIASLERPISPVITVSLDINDIPELKKKYLDRLESRLIINGLNDPSIVLKQLHNPEKPTGELPTGSIIALQQEFQFHLNLTLRTWEKFFKDKFPKKFEGKEAELEKAYQYTLANINSLVLDAYAKALIKAQESGSLDIGIINKELDKSRKALTSQAHDFLFNNILAETGVIFTVDELGVMRQGKQAIKEIAESTSATPNDIIHTSSQLGLATWISGSENTAHHRDFGFDHLPQRQIITHKYEKGEVTPNANPRIQIRTPSLDIKTVIIPPSKENDVKQNPQKYISDIANKLDGIRVAYNLNRDLEEPKAFIYNLHTAANDFMLFGLINAGDRNGNEQTQGAELILKGAHEYNLSQLKAEAGKAVFCYVQNLSVSGFGDTLGYQGVPLKQEATLMAEMALMHTLYKTCTTDQQAKIDMAINDYKGYLNSDPRSEYFSLSPFGQDAKNIISEIKGIWRGENNVPGQNSITNAKDSLKKLIAHDLHFSHDYAKLIQALSIFTETASLAGCKSGNERAQAINGRVAMLDKLVNIDPVNQDDASVDVAASLKGMAGATTADILIHAQQLKEKLDSTYNQHGLQQAVSLLSLADQGAASKLKAKPSSYHLIKSNDRNSAEESSMTNLHTNHSDSMQAHKGTSKFMWSSGVNYIEEQLRNIGAVQIKANKRTRGEVPDNIGKYSKEATPVHNADHEKHRRDFLAYLSTTPVLSKPKMNPQERESLINKGKGNEANITMEDLLDSYGVELYQKALEEERNSQEFKDAIWTKATKASLSGEHPLKKRFVAQILGPAGVGKTGAVLAMLSKLDHFMERDTTQTKKPQAAIVDGGDTREVSQVRRWALAHSFDMGYTGIKDLYDIGDSKILADVKEKDVEDIAAKDPNISIIIPTTSLKKNITKDIAEPDKVQDVIVQVIGRREVIAYQQVSRAWRTDWSNPNSSAESKAPPWLPFASYMKGNYYAKKGVEMAKDKDALVFVVVNDSILVRENNRNKNDWIITDKPSGHVLQVSERVYLNWKKEDPRPDLKEYSKRQPPIITTPELLIVETTIKDIEHEAEELHRPALTAIIKDTLHLQKIWENNDWKNYQKSVDALRSGVQNILEEYPPLPSKIKESLQVLDEQLKEARNQVPKDQIIAVAKMDTKAKDTFLKVAEAEVSKLGFVHRVIPSDSKTASDDNSTKASADKKTQLSTASSLITKYQEVTLKKDQLIEASINFNGKKGVLVQNHRGTVTDVSTEVLTAEQQTFLAVEQAKMFLTNWRSGSHKHLSNGGDENEIFIDGMDKVAANKVYAALLLLKDSHPSLKDIEIKSLVSGCEGPGKLDSESRFINRHLGSEKGPINKNLRELIKTELSVLIGNNASKSYKERMATINESNPARVDLPDSHKPSHDPSSAA